jgi:hypothetical protein
MRKEEEERTRDIIDEHNRQLILRKLRFRKISSLLFTSILISSNLFFTLIFHIFLLCSPTFSLYTRLVSFPLLSSLLPSPLLSHLLCSLSSALFFPLPIFPLPPAAHISLLLTPLPSPPLPLSSSPLSPVLKINSVCDLVR